jgi:hypothetical protein
MAERQSNMSIRYGQEEMWQLNNNGRTVRMALPGLRVSGIPEPITINVDFDAGIIDKMIDRLTFLRSQMTPGLPPANKRH